MTNYLNIPPFYTGGDTTYSGLVNAGGSITFTTVSGSYSPILDIGEAATSGYIGNKIIAETNVIFSVPFFPFRDGALSCTTSGCLAAIGFNYFSYAPNNYFLYQVHSNSDYIYAATSRGLEILDKTDESLLCTKGNEGPALTSVWGNTNTIYVGTVSGIYTLPAEAPCDSNLSLGNYNLQSNNINYIHGQGGRLLVSNASGIEYFDTNSNPSIHSKTLLNSAGKCYLTKDSGYYFSTVSGIYSLNRIDSCLCDWSIPTKTYTTDSSIFNPGIELTDMYITENTSTNNMNTIFCTTSSGVYIIDEGSLEYAIYYTR